MKTLLSTTLRLAALGGLVLLGAPAEAQTVPFSPFVPFELRVNFQPASASPVELYAMLTDYGQVFGSQAYGFSYEWNVDNTANMVEAGYDIDILAQRHARMQQGGDRVWEIAVPNGVYEVEMLAGDPSTKNGSYRIQVEDAVILSGVPTGYGFTNGSGLVAVSDGRLTVRSAPGAANNKLDFIRIHQK